MEAGGPPQSLIFHAPGEDPPGRRPLPPETPRTREGFIRLPNCFPVATKRARET